MNEFKTNPVQVALVEAIVDHFPRLHTLRKEHVSEFDEILPHLFFGDLERYCEDLHSTKAKAGNLQHLSDILNFLELAYASGNEDVQELISVSFLEHIPEEGDYLNDVKLMIGPNLRQQF